MEHLVRGRRPSLHKELRERARVLRREMTDAEKILWQSLRAHRFENYHFRRQQIIAGFIVDFYCKAGRLAIELDGLVHDLQKERDAERDQILAVNGVRTIRFSNDQVLNALRSVLQQIGRSLREDYS